MRNKFVLSDNSHSNRNMYISLDIVLYFYDIFAVDYNIIYMYMFDDIMFFFLILLSNKIK